MASGASIGISDVLGRCPRGHSTTVLDGTYDIMDGALRLRDAPESTRAMLESIRQIAIDAVRGRVEQQEAADAIAELAPCLAPILKATKNPNLLLLLALILWFVVEMTKAMGDKSKTAPIIIENRPTIINEVTAQNGAPPQPAFSARDRSVQTYDPKHSKRKERRVRGKAKEQSRQQLPRCCRDQARVGRLRPLEADVGLKREKAENRGFSLLAAGSGNV